MRACVCVCVRVNTIMTCMQYKQQCVRISSLLQYGVLETKLRPLGLPAITFISKTISLVLIELPKPRKVFIF